MRIDLRFVFACFATLALLASDSFAATVKVLSHDIGDYIFSDQFNGGNYPKYKIVTGGDGVANDVSSANPIPVTTISSIGKSAVTQARIAYSSTNVTTGAYVQLIASTPSAATSIQVFDSSGQTLQIGVGAAAAEVEQFIVIPGGNGFVNLAIPSGSRIAIKAVSGTANSGEIDINLFN